MHYGNHLTHDMSLQQHLYFNCSIRIIYLFIDARRSEEQCYCLAIVSKSTVYSPKYINAVASFLLSLMVEAMSKAF